MLFTAEPTLQSLFWILLAVVCLSVCFILLRCWDPAQSLCVLPGKCSATGLLSGTWGSLLLVFKDFIIFDYTQDTWQ